MKLFALACLLGAFAVAAPLSAAPVLYEGFSYTTGEHIVGKVSPAGTNWEDPSSPAQPVGASDTQLVTEGNLQYPGLATSSGGSLAVPRSPNGNISRLTLPLASGAGSWNNTNTPDGLFFSFTMRLNNVAERPDQEAIDLQSLGGLFAGFHWGPLTTSQGMASAAAYAGQVRIRREIVESTPGTFTQTGKYQLGIVKNNSFGTGTTVTWNTTQSWGVNDTILLVGNYKFNTGTTDDDVASLWINPTPGAAPGPATLESGVGNPDVLASGFSVIRSFWFRSDTAVLGDMTVDELRVGLSFADVTPVAAPAGLAEDYNQDNIVDGADFLLWQRQFGSATPLPNDSSAGVGADDLVRWKAQYGQTLSPTPVAAVPEPYALALAASGLLSLATVRRGQAVVKVKA